MKGLTIGIGSDHAGFTYKKQLIEELQKADYNLTDIGTHDELPVDYPDIAQAMAEAFHKQIIDRGILICGSGVGVSMAANKFPGVRAGICHDTYSAHQGVEHDNMNILCIGQRIIGIELAKELVRTFLKADFSQEERHQRRFEKVLLIESNQMKKNNEHLN